MQRRPVPAPLIFSLREMSESHLTPPFHTSSYLTEGFLQPSKLGKDRKTYLSLSIFYRVVLQVRLVNVVILFLLT